MKEINIIDTDIFQKYEQTELALHKMAIENAKKTSEILKLREELQNYKKADTSTNFLLPDEFKCRWETLVNTVIMDVFENTASNNICFMRAINIILKQLYEISKIKIKEKIVELLKCLNLIYKNEDIIKKFFHKFQKIIFQDYFNSIFLQNDEFFIKIISQLKNEFRSKNYQKYFSNEELEYLLNDLSCKNMPNFIKELYNLCLFMNINTPQLTIKTSTEINCRYYNKEDYNNIEGFVSEGDICLILINPPMVKPNISYRNIKTVVCKIENPSKEIKTLCENQNLILLKRRREQSKSFCGTNNNKLIFHKNNNSNETTKNIFNNIENNKNKKLEYNEKNSPDQIIKQIYRKNTSELITHYTTNNTASTAGGTNRGGKKIINKEINNNFDFEYNQNFIDNKENQVDKNRDKNFLIQINENKHYHHSINDNNNCNHNENLKKKNNYNKEILENSPFKIVEEINLKSRHKKFNNISIKRNNNNLKSINNSCFNNDSNKNQIFYEERNNNIENIQRRNSNNIKKKNEAKKVLSLANINFKHEISINNNDENSRNKNNANKDDFKQKVININNNNNFKPKYTNYSNYNKNINNHHNVIITDSSSNQQETKNSNKKISIPKCQFFQTPIDMNDTNYENQIESHRNITPFKIIENTKKLNKYNSNKNYSYKNIKQLTENSNFDNNNLTIKTTIKKITDNISNNYIKKIIHSSDSPVNYKINNDTNINNKNIKHITAPNFNNCTNLKYKNIKNKNEFNNTNNSNRKNSKEYKNHQIIYNMSNFSNSKDSNKNDISRSHPKNQKFTFNREFSTSSIITRGSQSNEHKQNRNIYNNYYNNKNNKNNNINNNCYQLKTEISERTQKSLFNANKTLRENYVKNNTSDAHRNSNNRNNYTMNIRSVKNVICCKKLNFQLNYELNQPSENNLFSNKIFNREKNSNKYYYHNINDNNKNTK